MELYLEAKFYGCTYRNSITYSQEIVNDQFGLHDSSLDVKYGLNEPILTGPYNWSNMIRY